MLPQKKITIISIICGFTTISLVIFVLYPLIAGIRKNSQDIILAENDLATIQGKSEKIESIKGVYQDMELGLEKIDALFIDPETPIDLIKFWEKLADDSNLSIDVSPSSFTSFENEYWGKMGFQIKIEGSYINSLRFLEKTENGPYLVEIQNLSISETSSVLSGSGISANIGVKVLAKKNENK